MQNTYKRVELQRTRKKKSKITTYLYYFNKHILNNGYNGYVNFVKGNYNYIR